VGQSEGHPGDGNDRARDQRMLEDNSWAFIITYEQMGYVEDDDADDIDYDELLETLQTDATAENEARVKEGYQTIQIVGWASKPYYDSEKKVLHWAKEIKFGDNELNTLNYNVRVLGRKGVLVLNAVSSMNELPEVQKSIVPVLSSFAYAEGSSYKDFNPDIDEVAPGPLEVWWRVRCWRKSACWRYS
jgi:Uncharacterized membrane-anchored protein conserved in bacteria